MSELKDTSTLMDAAVEAESAAMKEFTEENTTNVANFEEGTLTKGEKAKFMLLTPLTTTIIKFVIIGLGLIGSVLGLVGLLVGSDSMMGIYNGFVTVTSAISGIIPLSMMEILAIVVLLGFLGYLTFIIVRTIQLRKASGMVRGKLWIQFGYSTVALVLFITMLFSCGYGMAGSRKAFEKAAKVDGAPLYTQTKVTEQELSETLLYLIDKLNNVVITDQESGESATIHYLEKTASSKYNVKGNTTTMIAKQVAKAFDNAEEKIKVLAGPELTAKELLAGPLYNAMNIGSMYSPATGEILVNPYYPNVAMPMLIAKAMAKQRGYHNDAQANMIAYIVCTQYCDIPYIQYSAYFDAYLSVGSKLAKRNADTYVTLASSLKECVKKEVIYYTKKLDQLYGNTNSLSFTDAGTNVTSNDNYRIYPKLMVTYYRNYLLQFAGTDQLNCGYYVNCLVDLYRQDQLFKADVDALAAQYGTYEEQTLFEIYDANGNLTNSGSGHIDVGNATPKQ